MMRLPPGRALSQLSHRLPPPILFLIIKQKNNRIIKTIRAFFISHFCTLKSNISVQLFLSTIIHLQQMNNSTTNPFSILVPFASVNRKPKQEVSSTQRPLSSIIAENEIREQNLEYQHLLIRRKELEIELEDCRNKYEGLVKKRKKADGTLQDAVIKRDQAQLDCRQKRCYLQRYYEELDKNFRAGREDLFNSLAKLQGSLLQAYEKDEKRLRESLTAEYQELRRLSTLVDVERQRRNALREQLQGMEHSREGDMFGFIKPGDQLAELRMENGQLRKTFQELNSGKKNLEIEERILKRLQNIQEEHKRHSLIIENGIKKMFMNKIKDQRYKAAVSPEYVKNLQGLKDILAKKRSEKDALINEINEKKAKFDALSKEINQRNREYGQLQQKLMRRQSR